MSSDKTFRFDESVCGRCGRTAPAGCICVGTKAFEPGRRIHAGEYAAGLGRMNNPQGVTKEETAEAGYRGFIVQSGDDENTTVRRPTAVNPSYSFELSNDLISYVDDVEPETAEEEAAGKVPFDVYQPEVVEDYERGRRDFEAARSKKQKALQPNRRVFGDFGYVDHNGQAAFSEAETAASQEENSDFTNVRRDFLEGDPHDPFGQYWTSETISVPDNRLGYGDDGTKAFEPERRVHTGYHAAGSGRMEVNPEDLPYYATKEETERDADDVYDDRVIDGDEQNTRVELGRTNPGGNRVILGVHEYPNSEISYADDPEPSVDIRSLPPIDSEVHSSEAVEDYEEGKRNFAEQARASEEKHFKALSDLIGYSVKASDHDKGDVVLFRDPDTGSLSYQPRVVVGKQTEELAGESTNKIDVRSPGLSTTIRNVPATNYTNVRNVIGHPNPAVGHHEGQMLPGTPEEFQYKPSEDELPGEEKHLKALSDLIGYSVKAELTRYHDHEDLSQREGGPQYSGPAQSQYSDAYGALSPTEKEEYRRINTQMGMDENWGVDNPNSPFEVRPISRDRLEEANDDYYGYSGLRNTTRADSPHILAEIAQLDDTDAPLPHAEEQYENLMHLPNKPVPGQPQRPAGLRKPHRHEKMLSYLNMGSGGALVPPPEFTLKAKKKKKTVQGEGKSQQNSEYRRKSITPPRVKMGVMRATAPNRIDLVVEIVAKLFNEQAVQQFLQEMAGGVPPQQGKMFRKNYLNTITRKVSKRRLAEEQAARDDYDEPPLINPVVIREYQDSDSEVNPNAPHTISVEEEGSEHQERVEDINDPYMGYPEKYYYVDLDKSFGTKIILKRLRVPFVKNLRGHLVKAGFTGTMQDAMGRRMCFSAGKRVHCARDERGTHDDKVRQEEAPVPGNLSSGEGTANPVVQGIDVLKEIKFRIQGIASQCSLPPNAVRDVVLFLLEIPDEILIAFNAELDIRGEEIRAVLSQVIGSMVPQPEGMVDDGKPVPPSLGKNLEQKSIDPELLRSLSPQDIRNLNRSIIRQGMNSDDSDAVNKIAEDSESVIREMQRRRGEPEAEQKSFPSPDLVLYEMQKNPNPTELERMQMELLMRILNDR